MNRPPDYIHTSWNRSLSKELHFINSKYALKLKGSPVVPSDNDKYNSGGISSIETSKLHSTEDFYNTIKLHKSHFRVREYNYITINLIPKDRKSNKLIRTVTSQVTNRIKEAALFYNAGCSETLAQKFAEELFLSDVTPAHWCLWVNYMDEHESNLVRLAFVKKYPDLSTAEDHEWYDVTIKQYPDEVMSETFYSCPFFHECSYLKDQSDTKLRDILDTCDDSGQGLGFILAELKLYLYLIHCVAFFKRSGLIFRNSLAKFWATFVHKLLNTWILRRYMNEEDICKILTSLPSTGGDYVDVPTEEADDRDIDGFIFSCILQTIKETIAQPTQQVDGTDQSQDDIPQDQQRTADEISYSSSDDDALYYSPAEEQNFDQNPPEYLFKSESRSTGLLSNCKKPPPNEKPAINTEAGQSDSSQTEVPRIKSNPEWDHCSSKNVAEVDQSINASIDDEFTIVETIDLTEHHSDCEEQRCSISTTDVQQQPTSIPNKYHYDIKPLNNYPILSDDIQMDSSQRLLAEKSNPEITINFNVDSPCEENIASDTSSAYHRNAFWRILKYITSGRQAIDRLDENNDVRQSAQQYTLMKTTSNLVLFPLNVCYTLASEIFSNTMRLIRWLRSNPTLDMFVKQHSKLIRWLGKYLDVKAIPAGDELFKNEFFFLIRGKAFSKKCVQELIVIESPGDERQSYEVVTLKESDEEKLCKLSVTEAVNNGVDKYMDCKIIFDADGNFHFKEKPAPMSYSSKMAHVMVNCEMTKVWQNDPICSFDLPDIPDLRRYYWQRYRLFTRFDYGISLDQESWYSVTPEVLAAHQAKRCACDVIIDGFCGVGGNAIQLAKTCKKVIAIDIDEEKIKMAEKNAAIYEVADKITFMVGDFFQLVPTLKANAVFLSPPWGGVRYAAGLEESSMYDVKCLNGEIDGQKMLEVARTVSPNVAMYLPKGSNVYQIIEMAGPAGSVDLEYAHFNGSMKSLTAYYGDLAEKPRTKIP